MDWLFPVKALLDLIAPPRCASCQVPFEPASGLRLAFCPVCANACLEAPLPAHPEEAYAPFWYGGALADAVHRMKYQRDDTVASALGKLLAERAPQAFLRCEQVVPVPLGAKRLRQRGFDQAALLARAVARRWKRPFAPELLTRARETPALARMDAPERREAIRGAFWASARARGRSLLLIDDVYTTGATTGEAKRALLAAGATRVDILCLARTPKHTDSL